MHSPKVLWKDTLGASRPGVDRSPWNLTACAAAMMNRIAQEHVHLFLSVL